MRRLQSWLLNTVYLLVICLALPAMVWSARRQGKRRSGWFAKLWGQVPRRTGDGPCVWLHAVSVGEVNLLAPLIQQIAAASPDSEIWISTTTTTGYELASKKFPALTTFYCPLDFSWAVRRALGRVRPTLLLLAELELWPHLITLAKDNGVGVGVINGRLSDKSFRGYTRLRWVLRGVLRQLDFVTAQDAETAERFAALGVTPARIEITGSLKVDGVLIDRENHRVGKLRSLAGFGPADRVWIAGSTQEPEEAMALRVFARLRSDFPQLKLVLVPRHPERFDEVERLIIGSEFYCARRSELVLDEDSEPADVLLVDTVGELGLWWGTAHVGFVGGSFGDRGGQNMLEPAALGVATCFGPNTRNFREIVKRLLAAEAAVEVANEHELEQFVRRSLCDEAWRTQLTTSARRWIESQQGAVDKTMVVLAPFLPQRQNRTRRAA